MSDCPIKDKCMALFKRLYLPDGDPNKLTTTEFGIKIRELIREANPNEQEVINKAKNLFETPDVERGCPNDKT